MKIGLALRRSTVAFRPTSVLVAIGAGASLLSACASYHSLPLPSLADLREGPAELKVDIAQLRSTPLQSIRIDARDGLDPLEIAALAVLNSPDLRAKRAALGVR